MTKPDSSADKAAARRAERTRESLSLFDSLPDSARVGVPVACAVTGMSRANFYARSAQRKAPPIEKLAGGRSSGVRVGALRAFLRDSSNYKVAA